MFLRSFKAEGIDSCSSRLDKKTVLPNLLSGDFVSVVDILIWWISTTFQAQWREGMKDVSHRIVRFLYVCMRTSALWSCFGFHALQEKCVQSIIPTNVSLFPSSYYFRRSWLSRITTRIDPQQIDDDEWDLMKEKDLTSYISDIVLTRSFGMEIFYTCCIGCVLFVSPINSLFMSL